MWLQRVAVFFGYFLLLCFYYGIVCCGRRKGCSFRLSVVFLAIYRIKRLWHGNVLPVFIIDDGYRKLQQLCGPNLAPHAVIIAEKLCFSFRCGFGITVWTIKPLKKVKNLLPERKYQQITKNDKNDKFSKTLNFAFSSSKNHPATKKHPPPHSTQCCRREHRVTASCQSAWRAHCIVIAVHQR